MAPLFSVILRKAKAAVRLKYSAMRDNGLWYYLREDLVGKTQMEVPLKLHQMEARVDGKTFLVQRSFKPLAFPIGNSNKFAFKVSQFGIPIADVNPIADEGSNFEDNSLVVDRQRYVIDTKYIPTFSWDQTALDLSNFLFRKVMLTFYKSLTSPNKSLKSPNRPLTSFR